MLSMGPRREISGEDQRGTDAAEACGSYLAVALVAVAPSARAAEAVPQSVIAAHFPAMLELFGAAVPETRAWRCG